MTSRPSSALASSSIVLLSLALQIPLGTYAEAAGDTVWVEDGLPAGAIAVGNYESWNWVSSNPSPFSGASSHQSSVVAGLHQHYFYDATGTLPISSGDVLVAYVYLDPANIPNEVMLQWNDGTWEHRAYWGANLIGWGVDGTASRRPMGPLPPTGQWVRLEVPANLVGLEGRTLNGMAFSLYGGRATWDHAGKVGPAPSAPTVTTQQYRLLDGLAGANWGPLLFKASGGTPPYTWSLASGTLPPGLTLQASGRLEGRTSSAGTYGFTVGVTDAVSASSVRSFSIRVNAAYAPPASLASVPRPFGYVQSAFFLGGCTGSSMDCDPGDLGRNKALIRAYLKRFDGGEIFFNSLETASDFQRVRLYHQAVREVRSEAGAREFLGVYGNGRLPDFFFSGDLANQPAYYRAQALKSDGSLWERQPDSQYVLQTVFGLHAEHVDITNDDAVRALTDRLADVYDHEGGATSSVGPLAGFWVLGEAKATPLYHPFEFRDHADSPDNEDLVPATGGALRPACDQDWNERRTNPPLLRGGDPCSLQADGDTRISWLYGPKRSLALFSPSARDKFVAYASARGVNVSTLPADRNEFNDSDALVQLPAHVSFVPLSDAAVWNVWKDWVYDTWHEYVDKLARAVTFAQAGNAGFRGVLYFQLPGWDTFRPPVKDEIITYSYYDANVSPTAPLGQLRTASGTLGSFARYDELDGLVCTTNVEQMLKNPWITAWLHETTTPIVGLGGGTPDRSGDLSILANPTGIYEWNHQTAALKLLAARQNKRFGLFARYHYFGAPTPEQQQLSAADWEWNWDRLVPLFNPEIVSTLPPGYYLTPNDIEDPYKPLFAGSNGRFGPSWTNRMAALRCALNATGTAANPSPASGAANQPPSLTLSWTAGANSTSQNVYFGTSPGGLTLRSTQTGTTFNPGPLAYSTTYDWRIDGVGPCGTSTGPVWSFTTQPPPPADRAQIVGDTVPAKLSVGYPATAALTLSNTGNTTWTGGASYRLAAVGGSDPFTTLPAIDLAAGESIVPGQSKTFSWTMTAPATVATYTTDWRMSHGGVGFGPTFSESVSVGVPPTVSAPAAQAVVTGGTARFTVAATGNPAPALAWQYSNGGSYASLANGDRGGRVSGVNTTTLVITGVQSSDAGQYRCLASNGFAPNANSGPGTLTVTASASEIRVTQAWDGVTIPDGGSFTFPDTPVASLPISRLFNVCNDGPGDLTVANPTTLVSGTGFSQLTTPASTIAPGTCTSVRVRFHVASPGTYTGAITIQSNDGNENPYDIRLSGRAI